MNNLAWSKQILESLCASGVRDLIFCAGARNSPLIATVAKAKGDIQFHSFFEERSAAFFALGLSRRTSRPVAVMTTSGTAAAELLPAVIEAFHTGVPLILVTADRPRRLRGSGAPQAIDQTGLFAKFVAREFDLENGEMFSLEGLFENRRPIHINVCFDEPLLGPPLDEFTLRVGAPLDRIHDRIGSRVVDAAVARLEKFLTSPGPLVAIVGTLDSLTERRSTCDFLKRIGVPVYLEATSGLREKEELQSQALRSGDRVLNWALKNDGLSRVLRIGGVPTVRVWRDLDEATSSVSVFSLSNQPFSGLSRGEFACADIETTLKRVVATGAPSVGSKLIHQDRRIETELEKLLNAHPRSEPALMRELSQLIPASSLVYLGNSLPIREWDFAASRKHPRAVEANRGVNGIDGQLSTFIGLARDEGENWAVLGDLTALYDLTGPWAFGLRPKTKNRVVVINNGGGKIFQRIFNNPLFENRHDLEFSHWAKMWKLSYQKWLEIPQAFSGSQNEVIEIVPDRDQTERFWNSYDALWTDQT
jgi:2-succinyl-5-enolpyruvyl-6-hydroxy-3-cyclohexene-1-carboxylate synthase